MFETETLEQRSVSFDSCLLVCVTILKCLSLHTTFHLKSCLNVENTHWEQILVFTD